MNILKSIKSFFDRPYPFDNEEATTRLSPAIEAKQQAFCKKCKRTFKNTHALNIHRTKMH